jgi:hypothetical protein
MNALRLIEKGKAVLACTRRALGDSLKAGIMEAGCVSLLGGERLTLPRHFVCSSDEAFFEFTLRKPFLRKLRRQFILVELWGLDPPTLQSVTRVELCDLPQRRLARARLRLPDTVQQQKDGIRTVVVADTGQVLGAFNFHGLDEADLVAYTQDRVLAALRIRKHEIWVQARDIRYRSDRVPASSDQISLLLPLCSTGFNSRVPEWRTSLTLSLAAERRCVLCEKAIVLSENMSSTHVLSAPVRGSVLADLPAGFHKLVVSLNGRNITSLPLWIVRDAELLNQVRVRELSIDARAADATRAGQVRILRRNTCRSIQPSLLIETGLPAPNTSFPVAVDWSSAGTVLRHDEFTLSLSRSSQRLELPRIDLATLTLPEPALREELVIQVHIAGALKYGARFLILPDERLTNFEGQLKLNADDLEVYDAEYEEILSRIGCGTGSC